MATVFFQASFARRYTDGQTEVHCAAANYAALVEALETRFPGFSRSLDNGMAVAIDGEIYPTPLLEALRPDSEVHFLPPIGGG